MTSSNSSRSRGIPQNICSLTSGDSMKRVEVKEVIVDHYSSWGKWPDSDDEDYSSVLDWRGRSVYTDGNTEIEVTSCQYPAYSAYPAAGDLELPTVYPIRNALERPSLAVLEKMKEHLLGYRDRGYKIIRWRHAWECYAPVVEALKPYFLMVLEFGDDCPISTDQKTAPIAGSFDAALLMMIIQNYQTGDKCIDLYKSFGVPYARQALAGPSFAIAAREPEGGVPPDRDIDLVWVGSVGWANPERVDFLHDLAKALPTEDLEIRMHGAGMPHGHLPKEDLPETYLRSKMGVNYAHSSLLNGRFFDLPIMGIVQVMHDRWGEAKGLGILPGEHYLDFNGTLPDLLRVVRENKDNPEKLRRIASAGRRQALQAQADWTPYRILKEFYFDHLERLV